LIAALASLQSVRIVAAVRYPAGWSQKRAATPSVYVSLSMSA